MMQNNQKKNREFGGSMAAVFGLIFGYRCFYGLNGAVVFAVLSVLFLTPALCKPSLLNQPRMYWMQIGSFLGNINTKIILTLIYLLIFVPMGIILRMFGYHPLGKKHLKKPTYWQTRDPRLSSSPKNQF